jgi:hypothetical protein
MEPAQLVVDSVRTEGSDMFIKCSRITVLGVNVASVHLCRTIERHDNWRLFFLEFAKEIHLSLHVPCAPTCRPVADQINASGVIDVEVQWHMNMQPNRLHDNA